MKRLPLSTALVIAIWHSLIVASILTLVPTLLVSSPILELPGVNRWMIVGFVAVYIGTASASVIASYLRESRLTATLTSGIIALAGICLSMLLLIEVEHSRRLQLASMSILVIGFAVPMLLAAGLTRLVFVVGGFSATAIIVTALTMLAPGVDARLALGSERSIEVLTASQHTLEVTTYPAIVRDSGTINSGGAIAPLPTGRAYALATASGELYRFFWDDEDQLQVDGLERRIPINRKEFETDLDPDIYPDGFRVADLLIRSEDNDARLYASHHYWFHDERCFVVRVSTILLDASGFPKNTSKWDTIFESSPCLKIAPARGAAFAGPQMGGNMEFLPDGKLLLTVGDHQFDGWYRERNFVSDPTAHYGKTVLIDPDDGTASVFTTGHRNPQGLVVDALGRIWSTEHGPQGGDELNLLRPGHDYGYPFHTYGTEYDGVTWPPSEKRQVAHDFVKPIFAWVPSIAISDLVAVTDPAFPRWQNDLLIGSLASQQVWRVRIEEERVVYAEPIRIGERVRDISGAGMGEYVLWTDTNSLVRIRPLERLDSGAALFTVRCGGCHDDLAHRIGPTLRGLFQRDIASARGYEYSTGLAAIGGRWTPEALDAYIAKPNAFAQGTKMAFGGIEDPEARAQIIEFMSAIYCGAVSARHADVSACRAPAPAY
jgi:cytochrome c2